MITISASVLTLLGGLREEGLRRAATRAEAAARSAHRAQFQLLSAAESCQKSETT